MQADANRELGALGMAAAVLRMEVLLQKLHMWGVWLMRLLLGISSGIRGRLACQVCRHGKLNLRRVPLLVDIV